jgi:hypothetical protein
VVITNSFDFTSLSAIQDNDTIKSVNDWQILQEILLNNTVNGYSFWGGSQTEYDAISTKSPTTLYFITG